MTSKFIPWFDEAMVNVELIAVNVGAIGHTGCTYKIDPPFYLEADKELVIYIEKGQPVFEYRDRPKGEDS